MDFIPVMSYVCIHVYDNFDLVERSKNIFNLPIVSTLSILQRFFSF